MKTLDEIKSKYKIDQSVYNEIRKIIRYEGNNTKYDILKFQENLPYNLKLKLSMEIHKEIHQDLKFF